MTVAGIIRYFRDCYEADNRRAAIWNIFHPSVEHHLFVEGKEELLNGFLPFTAIDPEHGLAAMKAAYLYRKEKDLVYCSLFVVGWMRAREQEPQAICAPLIIHPVEILEEDSKAYDGSLLWRTVTKIRDMNLLFLGVVVGSTNDVLVQRRSMQELLFDLFLNKENEDAE